MMSDASRMYPYSVKLDVLQERLPVQVKVIRRIVWKNPADNMYYVVERSLTSDTGWYYANSDTKGYRHSTSAYAKLGRITNKDSLLKDTI